MDMATETTTNTKANPSDGAKAADKKKTGTPPVSEAIERSREHMSGKPAETTAAPKPTKPKKTTPAKPLGDGPRDVEIEIVEIATRGGTNVGKPEPYPFSKLETATLVDGKMVGPSFFIPAWDEPEKHVASARKRVRGQNIAYVTRKSMEVVKGQEDQGPQPGVRVWQGVKGTK